MTELKEKENSTLVSKFAFGRKMLRNEIKRAKGPFVVIANHEAALDFVNLIGATKTPMTFVISNSFYSTLPFKKMMDRIGVIPKQQFQTSLKDLTTMRRVIEEGRILVIYPAGLMCEDGRSTPIPAATYDFLKWLKTDVYVAKTSGTYFSMPKWSKGIRRGRTYMDIYKLFEKDEIAALTTEQIKERTDEALNFDAYKEQETLMIKYSRNENIEGLENVLYMCPNCHEEFTMHVREHSTIFCHSCGFSERSDEFAFLHKTSEVGKEIRYVSTWSRRIYNRLKREIVNGKISEISTHVRIHMLDEKISKFTLVGDGSFTLTKNAINISGRVQHEDTEINVSTASFASLPFSPGKYLEVQKGSNIYRLYPDDGRLVMKIINMVKIFYELNISKKALEDIKSKSKSLGEKLGKIAPKGEKRERKDTKKKNENTKNQKKN